MFYNSVNILIIKFIEAGKVFETLFLNFVKEDNYAHLKFSVDNFVINQYRPIFAVPIFFGIMPTKNQLYTIWESQFEFFGGSGQPIQTYGATIDEHGLTTTKLTETPLVSASDYADFEGEEIGIIEFDPENEDLKVIITPLVQQS